MFVLSPNCVSRAPNREPSRASTLPSGGTAMVEERRSGAWYACMIVAVNMNERKLVHKQTRSQADKHTHSPLKQRTSGNARTNTADSSSRRMMAPVAGYTDSRFDVLG